MKRLIILPILFLTLICFGQVPVTNGMLPIYFLHGGHRAGVVVPGDTTVWDTDALTYIAAEQITNDTFKLAVNRLVKGLKQVNVTDPNTFVFNNLSTSKTKIVYPFIGYGATYNTRNLLSPYDADTSYRLTYIGTPTFNRDGVWLDSVAYGNTHLNPSTKLNINHFGADIYSTTQIFENRSNVFDFGCLVTSPSVSRFQFSIQNSTNKVASYMGVGGYYSAGDISTDGVIKKNYGHFIVNAKSTDSGDVSFRRYYLSRNFTNSLDITGTLPNTNLLIGLASNPVDLTKIPYRTYGFFRLGDTLSSSGLIQYRNTIDRFQYDLNRLPLLNIAYAGHSFLGYQLMNGEYYSTSKFTSGMLDTLGVKTYQSFYVSSGGWKISDMVPYAHLFVDNYKSVQGIPFKNYCSLIIGLNDLSAGLDPYDVYYQLKDLINTYLDDYVVFFMTCTPFRTNLYEDERLIFNDLCRSRLAIDDSIRVIEIDSIPQATNQNDTNWFLVDKVHPTFRLKILFGDTVANYIKRYIDGSDAILAPCCAPSSLSAQDSLVKGVYLTWTENSDNEFIQIIERSVGNNTSYVAYDTVHQNIESFVDDSSNTDFSTTYYYRIREQNRTGYSSYSTETSITTPDPPDVAATDQDGNEYSSVVIGTQTWLVENWRSTKYKDGTSITYINGNWATDTVGQYGYPNNSSGNVSTYGLLYNWEAVTSYHGFGVAGWHVPTNAELTTLYNYLSTSGGGKLKETGTVHWTSPNTGATNETGFTGRGAGLITTTPGYQTVPNSFAWFWTKTAFNASNKYYYRLEAADAVLDRNVYTSPAAGFSVRLIKD